MHPDPAFRMDEAACCAFARDNGFAHVFVHAAGGVAVVHAPLTLDSAGRLSFHLSRRNRALPLLAGARAIASFGGPGSYVGPDWYETPGQVPTWNYVAVEAEGLVETLSRDDLVAQVDALGSIHEERLAPKPVWTRDKMPAGRFEAMLGGIAGFAIQVEAWRGTAKLSQNKPISDRRGVVAGLRAIGERQSADLVERSGRSA